MARSTMEVAFRPPMVPTSVPALIECAGHGRPGQKRRWLLHQSLWPTHRQVRRSFHSQGSSSDLQDVMGKAGLDKQLRDRIQGHAFNDMAAKHYDRYDCFKEKKRGLGRWAI